MSLSGATFKIVEDNSCLLYKLGDEFKLSGNVLELTPDRLVCLILAENMTKFIKHEEAGKSRNAFYCGGCTGYIKLECTEKDAAAETNDIETIAGLLSNFSFFQTLDEDDIRKLVSYLKLRKFDKDDIVIKKGEPGTNLFITVSGKVEVVGDQGISIAFMGKGEVFGEMSLLSGEPVGATIKVVKPAIILYIKGKDFRSVLSEFPSLQLYFARLLAQRLAERNVVKLKELVPGMVGHLSDMPPSELFQAFNVNQKTGRLTLQLPKGAAVLSFREGELVRAEYDGKKDKEAFYELLREKEGRFKFSSGLSEEEMEAGELGDFMWLLMEGVSRMDEDEAC